MSNIKQHELWIGGQHQAPSSNNYFDDLNPVDDSVIAKIASGTTEDVDKAVQNAHESFLQNKHRLARERETWFMKAADLVERDKQEYLDT